MNGKSDIELNSGGIFALIADMLIIAFGYILYTRVQIFASCLSEPALLFLPLLMATIIISQVFSFCFSQFYLGISYSSDAYRAMSYLIDVVPRLFSFQSGETDDGNKRSFFLTLVRLFFVPLMLQFTLNNFYFLVELINNSRFHRLHDKEEFYRLFNYTIYPIAITFCFLLDTLFFLVGYLISSTALYNTVKSVDTSFLGWASALLCYPPFNQLPASLFVDSLSDYPVCYADLLTMGLRTVMLVLLIIYTAATVNLGFKSSNLTNRGVVSHGVYAFVRHPAYTAKNIFWMISVIPVIDTRPWLLINLFTLAFLYFVRAITEERHLVNDPDYREYCRKVPYRFIPKIV